MSLFYRVRLGDRVSNTIYEKVEEDSKFKIPKQLSDQIINSINL